MTMFDVTLNGVVFKIKQDIDGKFIIPDELRFDGYGTATKPAVEEWVLAMKPLDGTFAENAIKWGCAGINVDAGRIDGVIENKGDRRSHGNKWGNAGFNGKPSEYKPNIQGRWPANLILQHHPDCMKIGVKKVKSVKQIKSKVNPYESDRTWSTSKTEDNGRNRWFGDQDGNETIEEYSCHEECPILQLNQQVGIKKSGVNCTRTKEGFFLEHGSMGKAGDKQITYGDEGHVSRYFLNLPPDTNRFFYSSKASRAEREKGCENLQIKECKTGCGGAMPIDDQGKERDRLRKRASNFHPTVKALPLIKYLVSLLKMPQNTLILDPFAGSGTLGVACEQLKIPYILIEKESDYCEIAKYRIKAANNPEPITKTKVIKQSNTLFDWSELELEPYEVEN